MLELEEEQEQQLLLELEEQLSDKHCSDKQLSNKQPSSKLEERSSPVRFRDTARLSNPLQFHPAVDKKGNRYTFTYQNTRKCIML